MDNPVIEKEKAVLIEANLEDFYGSTDKWKQSFYNIWRYQMTWDYAYRITVEERRRGVIVRLLIKPAFKDDVLGMMEDLGYRNVATENVNVAFISSYDIGDVEDILLE